MARRLLHLNLNYEDTIDEDNHNHTYNVKLETKVNDKFILATQ